VREGEDNILREDTITEEDNSLREDTITEDYNSLRGGHNH